MNLSDQGLPGPQPSPKLARPPQNRSSARSADRVRDQRGRLSHPVQRRVSESDIKDLISAYTDGAPIDELARHFAVNRTTVIRHLDNHGVPRRRSARKMTDRKVREAAGHYATGKSLEIVAAHYGVHARTLTREFKQAGIEIRARRGWPNCPASGNPAQAVT